ncbi:MAG: response regulator [Nitrososphaera sp.]
MNGSPDDARRDLAGRRTVMICDDEADILKIYSNFLRRKFNVLTALSGSACISTYKEHQQKGSRVDVLLVDYRLGDMLGDQVACQIKELDGTRTVLITAYDLDDDRISSLKERGCIVGQLRKPISLATLMAQIEKIIGQG